MPPSPSRKSASPRKRPAAKKKAAAKKRPARNEEVAGGAIAGQEAGPPAPTARSQALGFDADVAVEDAARRGSDARPRDRRDRGVHARTRPARREERLCRARRVDRLATALGQGRGDDLRARVRALSRRAGRAEGGAHPRRLRRDAPGRRALAGQDAGRCATWPSEPSPARFRPSPPPAGSRTRRSSSA